MGLIKDKIKQDQREEEAYKFYLARGWQPHQVSAIVGNLKRESNFNTSIIGTADTKQSAGLGQWHSDRLNKLKSMYGSNWTDFENQLEFVDWELNNTEKKAGDALRNSKGVWDAGRAMTDVYERPKVKWDRDEKRQSYVTDAHRKYSGTQLSSEDMMNFINRTAQRVSDNYTSNQTEIIAPVTSNISNLVSPIEMSTLAEVEPIEPEAVKKAKEQLVYKQQQQINQQRFIQDLITASQVQYVDPNQDTAQQDIIQQDEEQNYYQEGGTIYVKSKNDPRYQSYLDSLKLYNGTRRTLKELNSKELAREGDSKVGIVPIEALDKETNPSLVGFGDNYRKDGNWFLTYDKELKLDDAKKYLKNTPIKPQNFYKSVAEDSYYRPLYKKPEQIVEVLDRPILSAVNRINAKELVDMPQQEISSDIQIPNQYIQPRYWEIQDNVNQNFGGHQSNYIVTPQTADYMLDTLTPAPYNTRKVTPHYQYGGQIPISSNGVYDFPEQEVIVPTNDGKITMRDVTYPILGIDEYGNQQMMLPNNEYQFQGKMIYEIPQIKRTKNKRFS